MYYNIFRTTHGSEFEGSFIDICKRKYAKDAVSVTGSEVDYYEGTDLYLMQVPIDFTCNFSHKDHMDVCPEIYPIDRYAIDIHFGIRYANNHNGYTEFKIPVLVIGVNSIPLELTKNLDPLFEIISKNLSEIIDMGMDQYWEMIPE